MQSAIVFDAHRSRPASKFVASSFRYDDAANLVKLGGYGVVSATVQWPFAKASSLLIRGNNVFDK